MARPAASSPSEPPRLGPAGLEALAAEIVACGRCPRMVAWRQEVAATKRAAYRDETYWGAPVPGFGDPRAAVVVIGLAPAAHGANRTGRMFTGDNSGTWLYRAMHRAGLANQPTSVHRGDGLSLQGAYVTAPVRCAPPANRPTPEERDACRGYLVQELALLEQASVFVALGGFGYGVVAELLGVPRPRPRFAHGLEVPLGGGRTLLCSYHVSQQNTFTGRLTEPMLDAVFARAAQLAGVRVSAPAEAPGVPDAG